MPRIATTALPRRRLRSILSGVLAAAAVLTVFPAHASALSGVAQNLTPIVVPVVSWTLRTNDTFAITRRTIAYWNEDDPDQRMDVYVPTSAPAGRPMVLFIHPGGYYQGDKASFAARAAGLARQGYVTVSMNYRLSTRPDGAWPAQRKDLDRVLLWMRVHGKGFWRADPTRIGVVGSSAGGHLALFANGQPGVRAIAVWSPMVDPYDVASGSRAGSALGKSLIANTARCSFKRCPTMWKQRLRPDGYDNQRPTVPIYAANSAHELIAPRPLLEYATQVRARGGVFRTSLLPGTAHASGRAYIDVVWPATMAHLHTYL